MRSSEELDAENRRLRQRVAELERANAELGQQVARLQKRVGDLEALVRRIADDGPARPDRPPPGRDGPRGPPGAREGHEAHHRAPPILDEEVDVTTARCPDCASPLGDPIEVRTRVVEDLVPARLRVTRYRVHRYWCSGCQAKVEASSTGVLPGQRFGLHLLLLAAYLRTLGLTWGKVRAYLREAFRIEVSHGALVRMEATVAEALGPRYGELLREVRAARSVHADPTSWRIDGEDHWLWVLTARGVAYFAVRDTPGKRPIEELLRDYGGVVVSDFYPAFRNLPYRQQKCLVHLLRELRRFEGKPDFRPGREWKRVRMRVKRLVTEASRGAALRGRGRRLALKARLESRADGIARLPRRHRYALRVAKLVGQYRGSLFTFLERDGVGWENNAAERGLRPMVVNRKASFGSRSVEGADRRAVLQSVAETAHLRGTSFLEFAGGALGLPSYGGLPEP